MICELYTSYPPTVNNYYVKTQRGLFISAKGRKFRDELMVDAVEQLAGMEPIEGSVRVDIIFWVPDLRKRDLDNLLKPLFDAMTQANIWKDDSQIDQVCIYRGAKVYGGKCYIRVSEAAPVIPDGCESLIDSGE